MTISLYSSYLIFQEPLTATFLNNSAFLYGGAMYADNVVLPGHSRCAIQNNKQLNLSLIIQNVDHALTYG